MHALLILAGMVIAGGIAAITFRFEEPGRRAALVLLCTLAWPLTLTAALLFGALYGLTRLLTRIT